MRIGAWLGSGWAVGLLLCSAPAMALEISGIALPQTVHFMMHTPAPAGSGTTQSAARLPAETTLVLNGAGIRSKFIFDIYVGALYLPRLARTAQAVLAMPGPKRVVDVHALS